MEQFFLMSLQEQEPQTLLFFDENMAWLYEDAAFVIGDQSMVSAFWDCLASLAGESVKWGTLLAFLPVCDCGMFAVGDGVGDRTILPVLLPAALAFVWQRRDLRLRKRIEQAFEPHHTA